MIGVIATLKVDTLYTRSNRAEREGDPWFEGRCPV